MKKNTYIIILLSLIIVVLSGLLIQNHSVHISGNIEPPKEEIKTEENPEEVIVQEKPEEKTEESKLPLEKSFDVIVFGAEPEGIAAAISASRNNKTVLLVEKRDGPGGLMTYGWLNTIDMNQDKDGNLLSKGIFEEFFKKIDNKVSFDIKKATSAFEEMLDEEKNITKIYNVKEISVGADETSVKYAIIDGKKYEAKIYIDCTEDADITAMAGAKYTIGWEDVNEKNRAMSATLVIKLDNVDWASMCKTIANQNIANTGYTDNTAWAFGNYTQNYVPTGTHMRLKALNIGRQDDGSVLINSLQILNVNMLDNEAKEKAYEKCKEEASSVAKFIKENIPGFENSNLVEVAPELYVRETRHIIGEYKLTVKDMLESTKYNQAIAMASYPIDVQTTSIYDYGYIIGSPDEYYIPLGTIIPKGYTNLLTIGRSGSYTSIAAGSARVIPTGMTLAESGGIMAALVIEKNTNLQEMNTSYSLLEDLKLRMKIQGVYIDTVSKPVVDTKGQYYKYIIEMCEKGILSLGYYNKFDSEEIVSEAEFIILLKTYLKRSFIREDLWNTDHINLLDASDKGISPNRAKEIIYDITTYNLKEESKKESIEEFVNLIIPTSREALSKVRVYEILMTFKDFLVSKEI